MSKSASSGWSVPGIARDWDVDDLVNVLDLRDLHGFLHGLRSFCR